MRARNTPTSGTVAALFACFVALLPLSAGAQPAAARLPEPVARALAHAGIPQSAIGVYVHQIGAARPLLALGAGRALNPASTMKLVTTYAGLEVLGPAFVWNTEIYAAGPPSRDGVTGDLFIKGYGDPKLTVENFWLMLRKLRALGVREIRGDLVLDHSYFAGAHFDPGQFDHQPGRPYNTGPDALLVNFKAVTVQFVPDAESRAVRVTTEPVLPPLQIANHLTLDDGACGDWVSRLKIESAGDADAARLSFNGTYARDCGEKTRSFSILGQRQYVGALFAQLWKELGGTFSGSVRDGEVAPGATLLMTAKSETLAEVVRDINKFSNNVMADQLFLTLGAVAAGAPATTEKSREVITRWLAGKGLAFPELTMENGSGLSRIGRISARDLGQLLLSAFGSAVMPELMASLPLVAVDGTMRKRLRDAAVAGHAHVKTGSLAGVRSIAGYVLDGQGRRVVVVFIVNHANAGGARPAQDALLNWVYNRDTETH